MTHNSTYPDQPKVRYMRFDGTVEIPPGLGRTDRLVVYFYFDVNGQKGEPVRSVDSDYGTTSGLAACGTSVYDIPREGLDTTWATWLPYKALDIPHGRNVNTPDGPKYVAAETRMIAEPVLLVDDYPIRSGGLIKFFVKR